MGLLHEIRSAASGHGHGCVCDSCMSEHNDRGFRGFDLVLLVRLAASAALFIACLATERTLLWLSCLLSAASILTAGYDVLIRAVSHVVKRGFFDESLLMSVVAVIAVAIGEPVEGAAVILLYQLGQLLRGGAAARTRRSVNALAAQRSDRAQAALAGIRADSGPKSRTEDFIHHFSRVYTPVVLGIALVIAVASPLLLHTTLSEGIYRALVLMVIACPCALVVSVQLAYYSGVGGAAGQGVLFRSTQALDAMPDMGVILFDRAGALTGRGFRVTAVKSDRMDADVLLRIAAHACAYSDGVYAESIKAAYQGVIYIELIQSFRQEPGRGIAVKVDGVSILLGSAEFMREHDIDPADELSPEPSAYLAIDSQYAGRILFGSVAKPDVSGTAAVLSWNRHVAMITADTAAAAEKFARSVGIEKYYSGCSPEEKLSVLRDLRHRQPRKGGVIYVSDAETDAECLRQADVGIALGAAGSDDALEAADVAIMDDAPSKVVTAMDAARRTRGIVWQNILFALAFKLGVLALDMFGACPMPLAVFSDVGVALLTILNAQRAFFIKKTVLPDKSDGL